MTLNAEMSAAAAEYAQKIAAQGSLMHSTNLKELGQGENLSMGCGSSGQTAAEAVKNWYVNNNNNINNSGNNNNNTNAVNNNNNKHTSSLPIGFESCPRFYRPLDEDLRSRFSALLLLFGSFEEFFVFLILWRTHLPRFLLTW